jgi:hypothetical protein
VIAFSYATSPSKQKYSIILLDDEERRKRKRGEEEGNESANEVLGRSTTRGNCWAINTLMKRR